MRNSAAVIIAVLFAVSVEAAPILVPGHANPWLAGMPNGSTAGGLDSAPGQSPILASSIAGGDVLTFSVAGIVSNGPCCAPVGPDGAAFTDALFAPENGMSGVVAPINALMGVFLDDSQPSLSAPPGGLDFSGVGGLDFLTLSPALRQVFFIGDGMTSAAVVQGFIAPAGATRLFLGTMDGFEWNNNFGQFSVEVTAVPEPTAVVLITAGLFAVRWRSRRRLPSASGGSRAKVA